MDYIDAKILLPKFNKLIGQFSRTHQQKITDVFIGFEDAILTGQMYRVAKRIEHFQSLASDEGNYTVCVALQDGKLFSVKNIVDRDHHLGLIPFVESLSYMREKKYNPEKGEDFYEIT